MSSDDVIYHLRTEITRALEALLDDLRQENQRWTRDEFGDWLQAYVWSYPGARLVDLPQWRALSTLDDTKNFLFHIDYRGIRLSLAITQAAMKPVPDYLAITREVASP